MRLLLSDSGQSVVGCSSQDGSWDFVLPILCVPNVEDQNQTS